MHPKSVLFSRTAVLAAFGLAVLLPGTAFAQDWFDGFESYPVGTQLGAYAADDAWDTWDSDPAVDGTVSNARAASGTKSLLEGADDDVVVLLRNVSSGVWAIKAKYFLPAAGGGTAYFILMNVYEPNPAPTPDVFDWALQYEMRMDTNEVVDGKGGPIRPLIRGQWVEVKVVVDFDKNLIDTYYNGVAISLGKPYADGDGRNDVAFGAIDLYSGSGTADFWIDDVSVAAVPAPFRATQSGKDIVLSWGIPGEAAKTAVNIAPNCNADVVANTGDAVNGIFDHAEYLLLEDGYLGGDGLPPNGLVSQFVLQDYDNNNAVQFRRELPQPLADVTIDLPDGQYGSLLYCVSAGNGSVTVPVTVTYTDSSTTTGEMVALDWFNNPTGGLTMAIDGMDRVTVGGVLQDANNPGLFQGAIILDPAKTAASITLRPKDSTTTNWASSDSVFNLFALTTVAPVTYDITRVGVTSGIVNISVQGATSYTDAAVPEDTFTYTMVATTGGLILPAQSYTISWQDAVINTSGRIATWLILGQFQPGGDNPGVAAMVRDYLAEAAGGKTQANILPVAGMTVNTQFGGAAYSTGRVCGTHANCQNWFRYDKADGYIDFNAIYGDQDQLTVYNAIYLQNNTASEILAQIRCGSDDSILVMLDNVVWWANSVPRGHSFDADRFTVVITPGEHRLMTKTFEGGGGFGMSLGLYDLITGDPLVPPDVTISVAPKEMTAVPPPPTFSTTRVMPCYITNYTDPITVTINITPADQAVDLYELILPPWSAPTNYGAGVWDAANRILFWPDAKGSVSYTVTPAAGFPALLGVVADPLPGPAPTAGTSKPPVVSELGGGWISGDIGGPGQVGTQDLTNIGTGCMDVTGGGSDVWGTSDQFHYVWREASDNFYIQGTIEAFWTADSAYTNDWAKAGLMMRSTCAANSAYATAQWRTGPNATPRVPGYLFAARNDIGGGAYDTGLVERQGLFPHWGRLVKVGNTVTGYFSTNGAIWEQRGSMTLPDEDGSGEFLVGAYVTSHDNGRLCEAAFCNLEYGSLPSCISDLAFAGATLSWTNNGTYLRFAVERKSIGDATWTMLDNALPGSATSFVDPAPDTTSPAVYYRVSAYGGPDQDFLICQPIRGVVKDGYRVFQEGIFPTPAYTGTSDAHIITYQKDNNTGGYNYIEEGDWNGGNSDHKEALVKFDLSSIPAGSVGVDSAAMYLYYALQRNTGLAAGTDHTSYLHPVLRDWNQGVGTGVDGAAALAGEVTWNNARHTQEAWQIGGAYGATDIGASVAPSDAPYGATANVWVSFSGFEALAGSWIGGWQPNYGVKVTQSQSVGDPAVMYVAGGYDFCSSEFSDPTLRPVLVLAVTPNALPQISVNPAGPVSVDLCVANTVTFTATTSDGDGDTVVVAWAVDGGATIVPADPPTSATATFTAGGNYVVTATANDGKGQTSVQVQVQVTACAGVAVFTGNANGDATVNIADAITILGYLFGKPPKPAIPCFKAADTNDDDTLNIADAIDVLTFLFGAQSNPSKPMTGPDGSSINTFGCRLYPASDVPAEIIGQPGCATPCTP